MNQGSIGIELLGPSEGLRTFSPDPGLRRRVGGAAVGPVQLVLLARRADDVTRFDAVLNSLSATFLGRGGLFAFLVSTEMELKKQTLKTKKQHFITPMQVLRFGNIKKIQNQFATMNLK